MNKRIPMAILLLLPLKAALAQADRQWVLEQSTLTYHVSHPLHQTDGVSHAARGKGIAPGAADAARLKQISERQIIVVIQSKQGTGILSPRLRGFQRRKHVGGKLVHNIPGIDKIPVNAGWRNVGKAIVWFAGVNVERKPRGR